MNPFRIALIAPPFIPTPPVAYGGTERFVANLACGLTEEGHEVVVYANGESRLSCEVRSLFPKADWPIRDPAEAMLKEVEHNAWASSDALRDDFDVIHMNSPIAVPFSRLLDRPIVTTIHHERGQPNTNTYLQHPDVRYVAISESQRKLERIPDMEMIHHGIALADYRLTERKTGYLAFLGRICPAKGTHIAIEVAERTGIPLKIAGEVQPQWQEYWATAIEPHVDGRLVEYLGPANLELKNELVGQARAMLFPIEWDEPFGLVMIEAMACGTPVLALRRGSVPEVVEDGVSGWVCRDVAELSERAGDLSISPASCRRHVEQSFSRELMTRRYLALYERVVADRLEQVA